MIKKQLNIGVTFKRWKNIDLVFLGFIVCLLFQVSICYGINTNKERVENRTVMLGPEDNNRKITVASGDIIQIELEETGTAGYKWHVNQMDSAYLELISEETKPIAEKKVGAPVMAYWQIRALKRGCTEILMHYYRSWEGQDKALRYYRVKIDVI